MDKRWNANHQLLINSPEPIYMSYRGEVLPNEKEKKKILASMDMPVIEKKKNKYEQTEGLLKKINRKIIRYGLFPSNAPKKEVKQTSIQEFFSEVKPKDKKGKGKRRLNDSDSSEESEEINKDKYKIFYQPDAPYQKHLEKIRNKMRKEEEKKILANLLKVPKKEIKIASCYDFSLQSKRKPIFKKYFDPETVNEANFLRSIHISQKEKNQSKFDRRERFGKILTDMLQGCYKKDPHRKFTLTNDDKFDDLIQEDKIIKNKIISTFRLRIKGDDSVGI